MKLSELEYCPYHRDKSKHKLTPYKVREQDGTVSMGRSCPKCHVSVRVNTTPLLEQTKIKV
jgi:hypothetical protein